MIGNSWRLGRIAGIDIRIDSSWAVIALLITYSFYLRFALIYRQPSTVMIVALAIGAAIAFFGSVLTHEMAHAVVSRARGIRVQDITLFLFGGATRAKVESRGPFDELLIAAVGPLTSVALAGLFWLVATIGDAVLPAPVTGAIGYLAWVNLILALFNLVPGFPLDGGRLLRSALWKATGNLRRATRIASFAGQGVGYLLIAGGLLALMARSLAGGIWLAAIGWFLVQAARAGYEEVQVRLMLEKVEAEEVMARNLVKVPAGLTLEEAVDDYFMRHAHGAFPVEDGGRTIGVLTMNGVKRVPREEWRARLVGDSMIPLDEHVTVAEDTPMDRVMAKLQDGRSRVLVVSDGEVTGIITPRDVANWLVRWRAFEERQPA